MFKLWTVSTLAAGAILLSAGEPGVAFRFDDNKPAGQWREMGALFEKHGFRMSLAVVSQALTPEQQKTLKELAAQGHAVMDHLPNHAVYQIQARNRAEFDEFSKLPFVDHADPRTRKIYFQYELNSKHPNNRVFQGTIRNGELCDYPQRLKNELGFTRKIWIPSTGKIYGIRPRDGKKFLRSFWNEDNSGSLEYQGKIVLLAAHLAVQPPDALLRFLTETSKKNFLAMGGPAPKTWIQPGGWECFATTEKIAKICGGEFGYTSADCIPGVNPDRSNCFGDPHPERSRFSMRCDFTGPDNGQNFSDMKRKIADSIAKHKVKLFISHLWVSRVKGGMPAFLQGYDELLQWLKQNRIPVKTYGEWSDILYTQKQEITGNIMPPLTVDLDRNGIPDGYELSKGTSVVPAEGTVRIARGGKLRISELAGLPKGTLTFSLFAKGAKGTTVIFDFLLHSADAQSYRERKTFRLQNDKGEILSGTIPVRPNVVTMDYTVSFPGSAEPVLVKSPVLKK